MPVASIKTRGEMLSTCWRLARDMTNDRSNADFTCSEEGLPEDEPLRVLLIEDDEELRQMLAEALRREGWRVTACADVRLWLRSCIDKGWTPVSGEHTNPCENRYDIIVSDIRMPDLSGLEALEILQELQCAHLCPPTILITAFGDETTHHKARELGAWTVLDKPFATKDLIETVRNALTT